MLQRLFFVSKVVSNPETNEKVLTLQGFQDYDLAQEQVNQILADNKSGLSSVRILSWTLGGGARSLLHCDCGQDNPIKDYMFPSGKFQHVEDSIMKVVLGEMEKASKAIADKPAKSVAAK